MALVDQFGNQLKKEVLLAEEAAPTLTGTRSIISASTTSRLDPYRLANILRAADLGDATAYLDMAEELEEKDPHYLSVIGTRKRAVSQLSITVEPASSDPVDIENAELVKEWLDRDELSGEVFDILDAIGKGFSVTEIIWGFTADRWLPVELKHRDQRWFAFDRADGETLLLREGAEWVPLSPYKYIVHKHKAKSGLTMRGGLARPCAWMYLFKNFSIKDWVIFAEAYGQPVRIGKYAPSATKEDRATLLRAVANIGSDAAAIIPESMQIQFLEAQGKTGTSDVFQKLCDFCDRQMSKAVIGQTTTADAISGGHAVSKEHNEVRGDIEKADAVQLAHTLRNQLVVPIITLNKGPQKRYPRVRIGRAENIDIKAVTEAADKGVRLGIKVSERKVREMLNLPAPESDDDIIRIPAAQAETMTEASTKLSLAASELKKDEITALADQEASDWEEIMTPIVDLMEDALQASNSFEEFEAAILQLTGDLDLDPLVERLARAAFAGRIAGNHEIDLEK